MDDELAEQASPASKLPIIAVMVALIGLADSVYLTVQHLTAAPVPCSIIGVLSIGMAAFTLWLLYLQGFVIGAFCQFCLISALTTFVLFGIAMLSKFWRRVVSPSFHF